MGGVKCGPPTPTANNANMEQEAAKRIKQLEKQLAEVSQERDDLTRDLENLCLSAGANTTFSSSSVLSERIYVTEKELSTTRAQLQSLSDERDGLRDDLRAVREAKRQADAALEAATEKSAALDRELSFYQQQAAKVMADRDKAAWEAEELRGANLSLDTRLREASSHAETEAAQRRQLESQVTFLKTRLAEVEAKAAAAERQLQEEAKTLQRQLGEAEGARQAAEREAAAKQHAAAEAAAAAAKEEQRLQQEVDQLKADGESLRLKLEATEFRAAEQQTAAVEAEQRAQQLQREHAVEVAKLGREHSKQVAELKAALAASEAAVSDMRAQLEEVAQQKVAALMRQSTAETAKSRADASIERLMAELKEQRQQLEQATKEKVEALLQIAELKAAAEAAKADRQRTDSANDASTPPLPSPKVSPAHGKASPAAEKRGWFSNSPLRG